MTDEQFGQDSYEIYLKKIHDKLESDKQGLLDLHTLMYYLEYDACPSCNEWLVMRGNSEDLLTK